MKLDKTHRWVVGALLMLLMIATRGSHAATAVALPDASWAVFFLAAFYLHALALFPLFMLAAWLIDLGAVYAGAGGDFCLTAAYFTLVPAYGSLWLAGMAYARYHRERLSSLLPLTGVFLIGVVLCELFSSGGFYLFSGYFQELTWTEYAQRTATYFPQFLATALLYLALAAVVHGLVRVFVQGPAARALQTRRP